MCDLHNSFAHLLIEVQKKYTFVQHLHQKSTILTNPTPLDTGKGALYGLSTIQRASVCICRSTVLDLITQPRRTDLFLRRTAGRGNPPAHLPMLYPHTSHTYFFITLHLLLYSSEIMKYHFIFLSGEGIPPRHIIPHLSAFFNAGRADHCPCPFSS